MPQYCSKASSNTENSEMSAARWPQNNKLSTSRMKTLQKRNNKRRLDDGCSEVPRSAKKFISEENMANYLQSLHIANDTYQQQQQYIGVIEDSHPTQQELLCKRLQGDYGTDEAFYSPTSMCKPMMLQQSPRSSPEIRLSPPTPITNSRETTTKPLSLSRWDVIIEDLSSEDDDITSQESDTQPTIYLSPEARENLGKTHLLPPSIIDELCSKPCMELVPWVPKETIVQRSLSNQIGSCSNDDQQQDSQVQQQFEEKLWEYDDNMEL